MKYLFAAIDARQGRLQSNGRTGGIARPKYDAAELKQLIAEASEGVDEKSSTNDFVDTLERIVNEIKNTSEHSGAFLQKVKKNEVPDYYDVIKNPMDLATLLKRVKSQMYRSKRAFADDLDLIWSNCLLYNSHPSHPLRRSAEFLRQKSDQLLQFISDPSIPARTLFAASASVQDSRSKAGTPALGDDGMEVDGEEDGEADGESDGNGGIRGRVKHGGLAGLNHKIMNGVNGHAREQSDSPLPSRSQTPAQERTSRLKASRGPLGRRSRSPTSDIQLPLFEDSPAIVRTPQSMRNFALLDGELARMDEKLSWNSVASTSTLPSSSKLSSTLTVVPSAVDTSPPTPNTHSKEESRLANLVQSLNPPCIAKDVEPETPEETVVINETPDALWWQTVASTSSSTALASGIPSCPFSASRRPRATNKVSNGTKTKTKRKKEKEVPMKGLESKMGENLETLQKIRRLHSRIAHGKLSDNHAMDLHPTELTESDESDLENTNRKKKDKHVATSVISKGVRPGVFQSCQADGVSRDSMNRVSNTALRHAGFEGSSATALNVLAHVAAEYVMNLGRTLRFYSDVYGDKMSTEQILLHVLNENGATSPASLGNYVSNDIIEYGSKLSNLQSRLQKTREDQLNNVAISVPSDEALLARDGESFAMGEFSSLIGEDFLGLVGTGFEKELGNSTLSIPAYLFRGERRSSTEPNTAPSVSTLRYSPPPPYIPLTPAAVGCQIGLLRDMFHHREYSEFKLIDDLDLAVKFGISRNKVPTSGKILPRKRKIEDSGGGKVSRKKGSGGTAESEG